MKQEKKRYKKIKHKSGHQFVPTATWIKNHLYTPSIRWSNPYFWFKLTRREIDILEVDEAIKSCRVLGVLRKHTPIRILVSGYTKNRRPIHIVFSCWDASYEGNVWLDAVTVYEPEMPYWRTPERRNKIA